METTQMQEPWSTLILLTLFLLYIMLAGAVSVSSFLPERSPESEALRRVSLVVAILLTYNYGIRLWSAVPADMMWMAWVFFSVITAGSIFIIVIYWKFGLQKPHQSKPTAGVVGTSKDLRAPLLKRNAVSTTDLHVGSGEEGHLCTLNTVG